MVSLSTAYTVPEETVAILVAVLTLVVRGTTSLCDILSASSAVEEGKPIAE